MKWAENEVLPLYIKEQLIRKVRTLKNYFGIITSLISVPGLRIRIRMFLSDPGVLIGSRYFCRIQLFQTDHGVLFGSGCFDRIWSGLGFQNRSDPDPGQIHSNPQPFTHLWALNVETPSDVKYYQQECIRNCMCSCIKYTLYIKFKSDLL